MTLYLLFQFVTEKCCSLKNEIVFLDIYFRLEVVHLFHFRTRPHPNLKKKIFAGDPYERVNILSRMVHDESGEGRGGGRRGWRTPWKMEILTGISVILFGLASLITKVAKM